MKTRLEGTVIVKPGVGKDRSVAVYYYDPHLGRLGDWSDLDRLAESVLFLMTIRGDDPDRKGFCDACSSLGCRCP